jgi:hypothetical protein
MILINYQLISYNVAALYHYTAVGEKLQYRLQVQHNLKSIWISIIFVCGIVDSVHCLYSFSFIFHSSSLWIVHSREFHVCFIFYTHKTAMKRWEWLGARRSVSQVNWICHLNCRVCGINTNEITVFLDIKKKIKHGNSMLFDEKKIKIVEI